jgi:two-component system NarL family response regulator
VIAHGLPDAFTVGSLDAARRHRASTAAGSSETDVPVRILIADDQLHFRRGLRLVLESSSVPITVVAEASDGDEAIEEAQRTEPDVALIDIRMPGSNGLGAARAIRSLVPTTRILMLTVSDDPDDVAQATKAGAWGYLLKERSLEEVTAAVLALAHGEHWPIAAG